MGNICQYHSIYNKSIFKSLQNLRHRVPYITSLKTCKMFFRSYSETFVQNFEKYHFKNMFLKEFLTRPSTVILCINQGRYNFVSSGSPIIKSLWRWKYNKGIIEWPTFLVFGTSTAFGRSFLDLCTLTYRAVGTIWWDLSKHPKRRQCHNSRPLWLLLGTALTDDCVCLWYSVLEQNLFVCWIYYELFPWVAVGPWSLKEGTGCFIIPVTISFLYILVKCKLKQ